jgi:RNA polymerase sigma-70 factor (ECF subfamily)
MSDDERLIDAMVAYQGGHTEGFERVYLALAADVRRYFMLTVRDSAIAADLVQETFLEMHRSRHTYAAPLPVRPWVFGIARHVRWRYRRAALRRARHMIGVDAGVPAQDVLPGAAGAGVSGRGTIDMRDIGEALQRVPRSRRHVWLLHHVDGLSFQEIGARLRIGVGAAKLRSSRAMGALREMLGIRRVRGGDDRG